MEPKIDERLTRHIAGLARLNLTDDEVARFGAQLSDIVGFVESMSAVNTDDVEPTAHPLMIANVFRDDEVKPSLGVEAVLANAPAASPPYFKVPRVLDQMEA